MARQIELAKNYGLYGFCFHYYWFNGERLLENPLKIFLEHTEFDFKFCINWANENWTKRWDGENDNIIKAQTFTAGWEIQFIKDVAILFKDSRYIRINGKPVLVIYRIDLLPEYSKISKIWRDWCRENNYGEIYLILTHSFGNVDPDTIGFDAAVEFSPNNLPTRKITDNIQFFSDQNNNTVYDYENLIELSVNQQKPPYKKFKSICPGWDNEARKPKAGSVFQGSTPEKYHSWLNRLIMYTQKTFQSDERMVFINAWNEWAEAAYLEPDRKYGYAYLESTYRAKCKEKLIIAGHNAHNNGSQLLLLNIMRELISHFNIQLILLLKSGGPLEIEYRKYAQIYIGEQHIKLFLSEISPEQIHNTALCNSSASGSVVKILSENGFKTISLVHELPLAIEKYQIEQDASLTAKFSNKLVFPAEIVKNKFFELFPNCCAEITIRPQGLYMVNCFAETVKIAKTNLYQEFNLHKDVKLVLGCGFGDYRKGVDLFCRTAELLVNDNLKFIWLGNLSSDMQHLKDSSKVHFLPSSMDTNYISKIFAGIDIFFLSSREDPFPAVVLEALSVGKPIVAFSGCGGFDGLIRENNLGYLVKPFSNEEAAEAISSLILNNEKCELISIQGKELINKKYRFREYIYFLLGLVDKDYKKVSVIVPNYNYAKYLTARLQSIVQQTYPIYEIILLDDSSTDNSLEIMNIFMSQHPEINFKLICNTENSGSVFKQWYKGIAEANGEYIWIAEADDLSTPEFINKLVNKLSAENIVLAYSQSKQIDENDNILAENYLEYVKDISTSKWLDSYYNDGRNEIIDAFCVKNIIPNISSVIFKKSAIKASLNQLTDYEIAGDWMFYITMLENGGLYFYNEALNLHRRHRNSVTKTGYGQSIVNEIIQIQDYIKSKYILPDQSVIKIQQYRNKLMQQFNL